MPRRKKDPVLALVQSIRFAPIDIVEPAAYVEQRRLEYVKRAELIADEAREKGDSELELKAVAFCVRLTSLWKSRVDVSASNLGLIKAPDLSHLSTEQLDQINQGNTDVIETMAKKLDPDPSLN